MYHIIYCVESHACFLILSRTVRWHLHDTKNQIREGINMREKGYLATKGDSKYVNIIVTTIILTVNLFQYRKQFRAANGLRGAEVPSVGEGKKLRFHTAEY